MIDIRSWVLIMKTIFFMLNCTEHEISFAHKTEMQN